MDKICIANNDIREFRELLQLRIGSVVFEESHSGLCDVLEELYAYIQLVDGRLAHLENKE